METSEERTVFDLKQCRKNFVDVIDANHGHEFGSYGDSLMAEFASPVEALRAARSIQRHRDSSQGGDCDAERLQLRIGLHAGDVLYEGEDLFGDVVNTAARIQELARAGGIAISEFVYDQVSREPGFEFHKLGKQHLKNISGPIVVFEVTPQDAGLNLRRLWLLAERHRPAIVGVTGMALIGFGLIVYVEHRVARIGPVIEVPMSTYPVNGSSTGAPVPSTTGRHAMTDEVLAQGAIIGHRVASAGCSPAYAATATGETGSAASAPIAESS